MIAGSVGRVAGQSRWVVDARVTLKAVYIWTTKFPREYLEKTVATRHVSSRHMMSVPCSLVGMCRGWRLTVSSGKCSWVLHDEDFEHHVNPAFGTTGRSISTSHD